MQSRRVRVNEIEIACNEAGSGEPPLVMIHGLTGHRDDFREQLPDLGRRLRALAPDLRGHGDATHTGEAASFCFAQLVDDLRAFLDSEKISSCHLLGHSFGGMVALRFALAHPDRAASLIFMDTAPFAPAGYDAGVFEKAGAIAIARGMEFLQRLVEKASRAATDPKPSDLQTRKWGETYYAHMRRRYAAMEPLAYRELGLAMARQESLVPRLGEIRCPTTILVGDADEGFLPGADAFEAGIPGAHRITLEDAGHHPQVEARDAWLRAIAGHLGRAGS